MNGFTMNCNQARSFRLASVRILIFILSAVTTFASQNPLNTIPADSFDAKVGPIKTEACAEGGNNLASIHNGNYVVYKDYDFDSGVAAFKARVASSRGGCIEIRLDGPKGALLGTCPFEKSGGWQDWRDITCEVDNSQAGIRDIYLIFRGHTNGACKFDLVRFSEINCRRGNQSAIGSI